MSSCSGQHRCSMKPLLSTPALAGSAINGSFVWTQVEKTRDDVKSLSTRFYFFCWLLLPPTPLDCTFVCCRFRRCLFFTPPPLLPQTFSPSPPSNNGRCQNSHCFRAFVPPSSSARSGTPMSRMSTRFSVLPRDCARANAATAATSFPFFHGSLLSMVDAFR